MKVEIFHFQEQTIHTCTDTHVHTHIRTKRAENPKWWPTPGQWLSIVLMTLEYGTLWFSAVRTWTGDVRCIQIHQDSGSSSSTQLAPINPLVTDMKCFDWEKRRRVWWGLEALTLWVLPRQLTRTFHSRSHTTACHSIQLNSSLNVWTLKHSIEAFKNWGTCTCLLLNETVFNIPVCSKIVHVHVPVHMYRAPVCSVFMSRYWAVIEKAGS